MIPVTLGTLLRGVGTSCHDEVTISEVITDSRKAGPGKLFIAIVGERLDGNDYAMSALENGAEAAIVSRHFDDPRCIFVQDTKDAYSQIAGNYRNLFHPLVVAITGSVGKTTTKDMTAAIISHFKKTLKNEGNRNNEVGMPETALRLDSSYEAAVFEMGMAGFGEIRRLTKCARPHAAIITNIGVAHIEMLGSRENILKAKMEITEGLDRDGILILNADDDMLMSVIDSVDFKTATFGLDNPKADVTAKNISSKSYPSTFTIVDGNIEYDVVLPASGIHSVRDALSAYTLATRLGFDAAESAKALSDYTPSGMRQKFVKKDGMLIIEDCYNANPVSMEASLRTMADLDCKGRRIAVLADMLELGKIQEESHRNVGLLCSELGIDILLCYGESMKLACESAAASGMRCTVSFDTKDELCDYLKGTAKPGDIILFKGSHGMALEDVIEKFVGEV